jgi:LmbE family N-acetylglucosaminyl deacetylase
MPLLNGSMETLLGLALEGEASAAQGKGTARFNFHFDRVPSSPLRLRLYWALGAVLLLSSASMRPQDRVQVVADNTSYNVGSDVRLEVIFPSPQKVLRDVLATLRYAGDSHPVLEHFPLPPRFIFSGRSNATGYRELWKIPVDARTGRYEVDLEIRDPQSRQVVLDLPRAVSFVVHRKLVRIDRVSLDKSFYVSGERIGASVTLVNLTDTALPNLRVEFSERYWPWIGSYSGKIHVGTISEALSLQPHAKLVLGNSAAASAETVERPAIRQYAVVVWDRGHKNIYDMAFSPFAFISPPGVDRPKAYPGQYTYPNLGAVNVTRYREFYPPSLDSDAILFNHSHTMWPTGAEATVGFSIVNSTAEPWSRVSIRARLVGPGSDAVASKVVDGAVDLGAGGSPLKETLAFNLPNVPGIYRAVVEASSASGQVLATNSLELGVNALPKSILVFCAHEDDEGGHSGTYRAAIENHIPIHFVYFTSGDAGSCDRYYEHSCDPGEAQNFGTIRMEEVRAALGHLGVPHEDILFLGLPDGGSGEIWYKHFQPSNPFLDVLLATDHAPYEGLFSPNLPYARDSVVEATKELIKKFQPEVIYTAHPGDVRHIDHIVTNYFVVKALQELHREGALPRNLVLLVDPVHDPKTQPSTPYRYKEYVFNVSGEAKALAQEAGWFHQSQGGNREGHFRYFNELSRKEAFRQVLDWQEHQGWNEKN